MEHLQVGATPFPWVSIETEDQARSWVIELVAEMQMWRQACDVFVPDPNDDMQVKQQERNMWTFLTKQGQVTGALKTLRMTNYISDRCYDELHQKALNALIPTRVGRV